MIKSLLLVLFIFSLTNNVISQDLIFSRELLSLPVVKTEIIVTDNKQPGKGNKQKLDVKTYIPTRAYEYLPMLKQEQTRFWNDHPSPEILAGLLEHESCLSLTSARCWSPKSRLKSQREEGAGLLMITRTYRKDGSLRFDALEELKQQHPVLTEWNWNNVYDRPDLQIRGVILKSKDNYDFFRRFITDKTIALHFGDAGYNGGNGGVQNERRACKLTTGCDPNKWFGHVELHCLKSKEAMYGQRSACDINRFHVKDVFLNRSEKYRKYMM